MQMDLGKWAKTANGLSPICPFAVFLRDLVKVRSAVLEISRPKKESNKDRHNMYTRAGFILARVIRVKMKTVGNLRVNIMATGRPTRLKWQHRGSVTHFILLHMRSKLVVLGE